MQRRRSLTFRPRGAYDLNATLTAMGMGRGDPSLRELDAGHVQLAIAGPQGPLLADFRWDGCDVRVEMEGADCDWLEPLLPALLGIEFQPPELDGPRQLRDVAHRFAGLRISRWPQIFPRVVQTVVQQLISYQDACHGWRELVRRYGSPFSGVDGLMAPPTPATLARMGAYQFVECGILPQHGRRIASLARYARRIEAKWNGGLASDAMEQTCELLSKLPGIGPWTIGYLRGAGMGDSDAVVLGDYGFPKQVAYFFDGAEEADDDEMVRLLEPYRPHRFYVLSLIVKSRITPPRRGPRHRRLRDRM